MEVAWRGPSAELQLSRGGGGPVLFAEMKKKRAWGVDAHKVVQLMMGQLQSTSFTDDQEINTTTASARRTGGDEGDEVTLDLLGSSSAAAEAHAGVAGGTTSLFNLRPKLMNTDDNSSFLELELDPLDQQLLPRLPSDWKKCLDLKTGKMSFVNNTTGVTLDDDPRKQQPQLDVAAPSLAAHALLQERSPSPSSHSPRAHEFLRSKQSEILREAESLKTTSSSTSSSGGGSPRRHQQQQQGTKSTRDMSCSKLQQQHQMLSFSTGKRLWNLQLEDTNAVSLVKDTLLAEQQEPERSTNLELDLNLAAAAVPSSPSAPQQQQEQSVCTMAMVQRALRRTEQQSPTAYRKRSELRISILPKPASAGGTGSPSFSSLTSARTSDQQEQQQQPTGWSLGSPSTSSTTTTSSAISSRSPRLDGGNQGPTVLDDTQTSKTACTTSAYVGEVESSSSSKKQQQPASSEQLETASCAQLVMGACTHCLMYVMLEKSHPKCPRCSSDVLVNFAAAPSSAPTPAAAAATTTTTISSCIKRQRVAQA